MKNTVKNILYQIADIADEIVMSSVALEEALPPHNEYIVHGDLIRNLADALYRLEQEENND
ncbi:MAG: hypothetical protein ACKO2Z_33930 [Sphaerospermopsis kisseleviana]